MKLPGELHPGTYSTVEGKNEKSGEMLQYTHKKYRNKDGRQKHM